jgi:hypothetical protein
MGSITIDQIHFEIDKIRQFHRELDAGSSKTAAAIDSLRHDHANLRMALKLIGDELDEFDAKLTKISAAGPATVSTIPGGGLGK